MGIRNYLIEGVSGTGKTSVCNELQRRGYQPIHGDRELAYQGDPETGARTDGVTHEHHIWHVDKVRGGKKAERELIVRLHRTKEDIPQNGIIIDATASIAQVVDEIIRLSETNKCQR
ncbi:hypothetical protein [Paenibacillus sp. P36]|uniref:hypothetical protein n=1 Tax=Paenibacillus sp. P36 TaxID=3342538 RepID=UPI0038B27C06